MGAELVSDISRPEHPVGGHDLDLGALAARNWAQDSGAWPPLSSMTRARRAAGLGDSPESTSQIVGRELAAREMADFGKPAGGDDHDIRRLAQHVAGSASRLS